MIQTVEMFKPGQLVKIKLDKKYAPCFIIENGKRAIEQHKNSYTGIVGTRRKLKAVPPDAICLFLEYNGKNVYLLLEEQIIEAHMDWIEPL